MNNGLVQRNKILSYAAEFPIYFLSIWDRKAESRTVAATMKSFCLQALPTCSLNTNSSNCILGCNARCYMFLFYSSLVPNLNITFSAIYNPRDLGRSLVYILRTYRATLMKINVYKNYVLTSNVKSVLFPYYLFVLLPLMLGHESKLPRLVLRYNLRKKQINLTPSLLLCNPLCFVRRKTLFQAMYWYLRSKWQKNTHIKRQVTVY